MTPSAQEKFEILSRFCACMEDVYSWGHKAIHFFQVPTSSYAQSALK